MAKHSWHVFILLSLAVGGCKDMGTDVLPRATAPAITGIQPDSAAVGDTVTIDGANFGSAQGSSTVSFGSAIADTTLSWSETRIQVKVPAAAVSGSVSVTVGGVSSNAAPFKLRGAVAPGISFKNDVLPVFQTKGCTGCHGGTNQLYVDSYAHLMLGNSLHGPVVTPDSGEQSVIIKKLRGTAGFGVRMPYGGPYLDDATIATISLWITQGALNN